MEEAKQTLQKVHHAVETLVRQAQDQAKEAKPSEYLITYVNNVMENLSQGIDTLYGGAKSHYQVGISKYLLGSRALNFVDEKGRWDRCCFLWTADVGSWHLSEEERKAAQVVHIDSGVWDKAGTGFVRLMTIARFKLSHEQQAALMAGQQPLVGDLFMATSDAVSRVIRELPAPPGRIARAMAYGAENGIVP